LQEGLGGCSFTTTSDYFVQDEGTKKGKARKLMIVKVIAIATQILSSLKLKGTYIPL
jgi:hypothetical protein